MLSQDEEQFLTKFYSLCSRYKFAGIVPYSRGQCLDHYEVALMIPHPASTDSAADKKRPGRHRSE